MPNFLSDYNLPVINSVQATNVLANTVLQNLYQEIIENDGEGVTQKFSTDATAAKITVIRFLPNTQKARKLGASYNGGNFPTTYGQPQTENYELEVITVIDEPVWIRKATRDMLKVDVLEAQTKVLAQNYALNLNAMTVAGKVAKSLLTSQCVEVTLTGDGVRTAVTTANSTLDNGDKTNGVHMFPGEDRIGVVRPSFRPYLMSSAGVLIGGSNYAQDILKNGGVDATSKREYRRGFIGVIDSVPFYLASGPIWDVAEEYLGVPAGTLNDVYGYISSGIGNLRGLALDHNIKIVDTLAAQGVALQPDCRMGFETIYPKSNVFLVKSGFKAFDNYADLTAKLKLLAPGSRELPTLTLVAADGVDTAAGVTPTTTLGKDNTAVSKKYFFAASGTIALTPLAFEAAYATADKGKGAFTTSKVSPSEDGAFYGYFQVVDSLGNIVVKVSDLVTRS